jgi:acyl-CoA reductase-like NAD-dependent aldehyde dehydrogenase
MEVIMEETFGPVVGIMKVEGDEEALQLMNDSPYGLVSLSILLHLNDTNKTDRISMDKPR